MFCKLQGTASSIAMLLLLLAPAITWSSLSHSSSTLDLIRVKLGPSMTDTTSPRQKLSIKIKMSKLAMHVYPLLEIATRVYRIH